MTKYPRIVVHVHRRHTYIRITDHYGAEFRYRHDGPSTPPYPTRCTSTDNNRRAAVPHPRARTPFP